MFISKNEFKTETQKNGERTARAVKRWSRLLESKKGFDPIKTKSAKETTAVLLENQMRYLTEAAVDTSVFGGPVGSFAGASAGALTNGDTYAQGDFRLPRLLIPMVRRIYPNLMSNETVGVQPMPGPVAYGYALRYQYGNGANIAGDSTTKHVHDSAGKPHGTKGVNTTAVLAIGTVESSVAAGDTVDATLTVIQGEDYPKQVAVSATVVKVGSASEKAVVYVDAFGYTFTAASNAKLATAATFTAKVVGAGDHTAANNEMGWHRLDTRHTGRQHDGFNYGADGKPLAKGKWKFRVEDTGIAALMQQFEGTGAVAKANFSFMKKSVEAGTRRIGTSWTLETEQDLKNTNGVDVESEVTQQMSYELQAEIDREMTVRMLFSALSNGEWSLWDGQLADARWAGERGRAFYNHIVKMSLRMQTRNRRGPANFIVCTPDVAALLETLEEFTIMPVNSSVTTANMASAKVGTLGGNRFNVYIDTRTPVYDTTDYGADYGELYSSESESPSMPNYAMLGYKGVESFDSGIIYCPYIPIMVQSAINPDSMEPQVGLMTRYGVLDNIFGAHLYYHVIIVDSFSQPGLDDQYKHIYPAGYVTKDMVQDGGTTNVSFAYPVQQVTE